MPLHQRSNTVGSEIYNTLLYNGSGWPLHLYRSFEFTRVETGTVQATVGDRHYTAGAGDCLLIFPYQAHAYECVSGSYYVVVFDGERVGQFSSRVARLQPETALFRLPQAVDAYLHACLLDRFQEVAATLSQPATAYEIKSGLYALCAAFYRQVKLLERAQDGLVADMLAYIEAHFTEEISLRSMAAALSRDYHYLSRVFNQTFAVHFSTLLNQYRYEEALTLLRTTDLPLTEIALRSGFQSIRSFNRCVREISGQTPSQLRAQPKAD